MTINLMKGQKVDLTKGNPNLKKIKVGLSWGQNKYSGGEDFDLDASVFLLNAQGKCPGESDIVFYNNPKHISGAVLHSGDDRTGGSKMGGQDDETVIIDITKIPTNIERLTTTVTIFEAQTRKQNFGMVSGAYCRVYDADTGQELFRYNLEEDFSIETAIVICEIYRYQGEWKFSAVGSGYKDGLSGLCKSYGLSV